MVKRSRIAPQLTKSSAHGEFLDESFDCIYTFIIQLDLQVISLRLQKYMADCGVASRRACEKMIAEGKVVLNGKVVINMGVQVQPEKDIVVVNGRRLTYKTEHDYYLFYKPRGMVCTLSDENDRACIGDFLKKFQKRLFPVGRLDMDSEGLLLLTDDGEFANAVMHPSGNVSKVYRITIDKRYSHVYLDALYKGVDIGDVKPAVAKNASFTNRADGRSVVEMELTEGRNREARRMLESQGFGVLRLKRIRIGGLELGDLKPGGWKRIHATQARKAFQ